VSFYIELFVHGVLEVQTRKGQLNLTPEKLVFNSICSSN